MQSNHDNVLWEMNNSIDASKEDRVFIDKQLHYTTDNNTSGNYTSNQIEFNTLASSNSGRINDYGNGFIDIPLVIAVEGDGVGHDINKDKFDYLMCLKNMNVSIINSVNVDIGTTSVVNAGVDNIPMYQNFLAHTTWSAQDEELNGPTCGYAKDGNSYSYSDAVSLAGHGLFNNSIMIADIRAVNRNGGTNLGAKKRCEAFHSLDSDRIQLLNKLAMKNASLNYVERANDNVRVYYYNCQIPLKQIHPFFEKLPLNKGCNIKLKLFLNAPFNITVKSNASEHLSTTGLNMTGGSLICPIMISSAEDGAGGFAMDKDVNYKISCGITKVLAYEPHIKSNCRLYYYSYKGSAEYESKFMSSPNRSLRFTDLFYSQIDLVTGAHFAKTLSTTMPRVSRLIIIPQYGPGANGIDNTVGTLSSPFDSAPGSCVPCLFENFQVRIDDNTVYSNPVSYTYEQYLLEQAGRFGINNNLVPGLCSSRLSKTDFETNYGYYVVDLQKRESAYDNVNHSVALQGKLVSAKDVTLHCFIEYDKTISINVVTGAVEV